MKEFRLIRWRPGPTKAPQSGWSIFYLEIPTGYRIEERCLKDLVGFGIVRNLRDAENYGNSLNFLFEFVGQCILFLHKNFPSPLVRSYTYLLAI